MEEKKVWTKESVAELLDRLPAAQLSRPLLALWGKQTEDERATHTTKHLNDVGFSGFDAKFAGSLVEWWRRKGFFTEKQANALRKVLKKYRRQLADIANQKTAEA